MDTETIFVNDFPEDEEHLFLLVVLVLLAQEEAKDM